MYHAQVRNRTDDLDSLVKYAWRWMLSMACHRFFLVLTAGKLMVRLRQGVSS